MLSCGWSFRPAKSADAPPLPSSSKTASLYNSGPVSLFDASSSSSDELPSNSDSEALDHSDGSSIDSQDAKTSTRATAFSQQQISLGIAANSISNSRSSLDPVVLAQELETERARSQELEKASLSAISFDRYSANRFFLYYNSLTLTMRK